PLGGTAGVGSRPVRHLPDARRDGRHFGRVWGGHHPPSRGSLTLSPAGGCRARRLRHNAPVHTPSARRVMSTSDICFTPAIELRDRLARRDLSAREVMEAFRAQIDRVNPTINAIVSKLDDERALQLAADADERMARGEAVGPLHGLPHAVKDLVDAVGFPTTMGSPLHVDDHPEHDCLFVERIRRAGALIIGKTNVPEFGLGSHSFNPVFGATKNPYDHTKSAGGSSGGAGAALATGMLPLADGSDSGGSLRNPGNFNNVVGFRVSPGLVPAWPNSLPWMGIGVKGPMGRTVEDAALLLSVMAGPDPRDQL